MNTEQFINLISENSNKQLRFVLPEGDIISGDLHITEIKNMSIQSVDCGGFEHNYDETIVQLWIGPGEKSDASWDTGKAKKIFNVVGRKMNYQLSSEIFFEYGNSDLPVSKYSVKDIESDSSGYTIHLYVKPTVCKPRLSVASGCC